VGWDVVINNIFLYQFVIRRKLACATEKAPKYREALTHTYTHTYTRRTRRTYRT